MPFSIKTQFFRRLPLGVFIEVPGDRCDLSDPRKVVMNFSGLEKLSFITNITRKE